MRFGQLLLFSSIAFTLTIPAVAASRTHRGPTAAHRVSSRHTAKPKVLGQRTIDDQRAAEIQQALIKAGYLSGQPSGHWDGQTEAAMQKVQADNGWQTKLVPDSRALIKLGLGPSNDSVDALSESVAAPALPTEAVDQTGDSGGNQQ